MKKAGFKEVIESEEVDLSLFQVWVANKDEESRSAKSASRAGSVASDTFNVAQIS